VYDVTMVLAGSREDALDGREVSSRFPRWTAIGLS
jgi:hypothetical protein